MLKNINGRFHIKSQKKLRLETESENYFFEMACLFTGFITFFIVLSEAIGAIEQQPFFNNFTKVCIAALILLLFAVVLAKAINHNFNRKF